MAVVARRGVLHRPCLTQDRFTGYDCRHGIASILLDVGALLHH
jgi:hypothetical protein